MVQLHVNPDTMIVGERSDWIGYLCKREHIPAETLLSRSIKGGQSNA
jgi:hypothetical protein